MLACSSRPANEKRGAPSLCSNSLAILQLVLGILFLISNVHCAPIATYTPAASSPHCSVSLSRSRIKTPETCARYFSAFSKTSCSVFKAICRCFSVFS
ncbi:hypothetical protein CPB85DRAFT_155798 [Mucidula mucida]|nr:hypothetical protein CPB85DRAFT_155798 [Mucidula mucida]